MELSVAYSLGFTEMLKCGNNNSATI